MIQQLREQTQSLFFKLLLGFISITFVISFGIGSFFGDQKEVIATVDDTEILLKDYRQAYGAQMERFRQMFGERADQFAEQTNLRQNVLNSLIDQEILFQRADALGFKVPDKAIQDYIKNQEVFHKDGHFDFDTYHNILKQNRLTLDEYENSIRKELRLQQIREAFGSGLVVSEAEVEQLFLSENEKFDIGFIEFIPSAFIEEVEYTQDDLQTYYDAHKTNFESKRQYRLEYFTLNLENFRPDTVRDREIERYYEKNQDLYSSTGEVKARHILIKTDPKEDNASKEEKRQRLEAIQQRIEEGESFEELAKIYSEDFSKEQGGDLGWFKAGDMVPEFESAAFALNVGEVSDIVESGFGFHLIKVDDKKEAAVKPLEDVREEIVEVLSERRAQKRLDREFEKLDQRLGTEDLASIAKEFETSIKTTAWFAQDGVISGIGSVKELANQIRLKEAGDVGRWKRDPVRGYVFYKILEIQEPEIQPLSEVEDQVIASVKEEKAKELAKTKAKEALTALKGGIPLEKIAESYQLQADSTTFSAGSQFIPKIGDNNPFKQTALTMGETNSAEMSVSGNKVHLLQFRGKQLDTINEATKKNDIRNRLRQQLERIVLEREIRRLRQTTDVEILNPLFQQHQS